MSVSSSRVKKPICLVSIVSPAVCSVKWRRFVLRPSIFFRSVGRSGATRSITFMRSASSSVRLDALRTARSAHFALRPCERASPRKDAAASLRIFRFRSLPMFAPLPVIGVDEPMFVFGAIASTSAASEIQTPALAARAPFGET
jgi:hypothetical protein